MRKYFQFNGDLTARFKFRALDRVRLVQIMRGSSFQGWDGHPERLRNFVLAYKAGLSGVEVFLLVLVDEPAPIVAPVIGLGLVGRVICFFTVSAVLRQ